MCKVLLIPGIKKETSENAWKFIKAMAKPMSIGNRDGLGYAAITESGDLFGERWLSNPDAFEEETPIATELDKQMFGLLGEAVDGTAPSDPKRGEYNSFGKVDRKLAVAVTLHTRYATAPKGMENTHPFVDEGVSLIHNGVIRNADEIGLKISTCDSEAVLRQYLDRDVKSNPENFQDVASTLEGYYACGVLTNTEAGPIMDVFKGNHASLYVAFVKELETYVLSTSDSDIKEVCKDLGFRIGDVYKILEGKFIRVNAVTHETISTTPFKVGVAFKNTFYPPYKASHSTQATNETGAGSIIDATDGNRVLYPFGKNKKSTPITNAEMQYFKQGKANVEILSEIEIQAEIMKMERWG